MKTKGQQLLSMSRVFSFSAPVGEILQSDKWNNEEKSIEQEESIKDINLTMVDAFVNLKQDCFDLPIVHSVNISNIGKLKSFTHESKNESKNVTLFQPKPILSISLSNRSTITSNTKQLLQQYQSFHEQLLNNNNILKKHTTRERKLRIATQTHNQLKPIYISVFSRKKKGQQIKNKPLIQQDSFFCCGTYDNNNELEYQAPIWKGKRNYLK